MAMRRYRTAPRYVPVGAVVIAALSIVGLIGGAFPAAASITSHPGVDEAARGGGASAVPLDMVATTTTTKPSSESSVTSTTTSASRRRNADQVDVLTATREEVNQKIAKLDEQYGEQQAAVDAANASAAVAQQGVDRANARVALAQNEVEIARQTVRAYAVEAYITPPAQDSLRVLSLDKADDASYASDVIKILADERHKVVDVLVEKQAVAAEEQVAADEAARGAADQLNAAQGQLAELDGIRAEQEALSASLDDRLDAALAEAAALAEVDRQMAAELAAQEIALRQAAPTTTVKPAAPAATPNTATPPTTKPGGGVGSPATTAAPTQTTRPPTVPTTPPTSPGIVTWAEVTNVGGIYVHTSIASQLRGLLDAAAAAGFSLRGGGYRDSAAQIATRQANCGTTYYDIYQKPASQCTPPTAIPGRSMHEQGRAIDFTSGGLLISTRTNPAFIWLTANAARFGFKNLPSEPWHWSTNGN